MRSMRSVVLPVPAPASSTRLLPWSPRAFPRASWSTGRASMPGALTRSPGAAARAARADRRSCTGAAVPGAVRDRRRPCSRTTCRRCAPGRTGRPIASTSPRRGWPNSPWTGGSAPPPAVHVIRETTTRLGKHRQPGCRTGWSCGPGAGRSTRGGATRVARRTSVPRDAGRCGRSGRTRAASVAAPVDLGRSRRAARRCRVPGPPAPTSKWAGTAALPAASRSPLQRARVEAARSRSQDG